MANEVLSKIFMYKVSESNLYIISALQEMKFYLNLRQDLVWEPSDT